MMTSGTLHTGLLTAALTLTATAWAQGAPGSDPIVLGGAVSYQALPTPTVQASGQIDGNIGIPPWMQAKISRYEAKAFAQLEGESGVVKTENDVISVQKGNALARTCTTNVSSNTGAAAAGPSGHYDPNGSADQITVLRGDLVTICK